MEKSRSEILTEIKESLESLKSQVAELEARITAFEAEPEEETVEEIPAEEADLTPIDISLDEEDFVSEAPKESINDKQEKVGRKAVMDVMSEKCAWRTAMPGTPVKNIISAISLNDRVLFINTLFKEDPMAFQDAISALNAMSSFAEAEAYIRENHPDWNLNSDIVYRMMMAIRRKLK